MFNGGGKLLWWVGQCKPFNATGEEDLEVGTGGSTKCGNPMPPTPPKSAAGDFDGYAALQADLSESDLRSPAERLGRKLTPINVTTYGWYYTW